MVAYDQSTDPVPLSNIRVAGETPRMSSVAGEAALILERTSVRACECVCECASSL